MASTGPYTPPAHLKTEMYGNYWPLIVTYGNYWPLHITGTFLNRDVWQLLALTHNQHISKQRCMATTGPYTQPAHLKTEMYGNYWPLHTTSTSQNRDVWQLLALTHNQHISKQRCMATTGPYTQPAHLKTEMYGNYWPLHTTSTSQNRWIWQLLALNSDLWKLLALTNNQNISKQRCTETTAPYTPPAHFKTEMYANYWPFSSVFHR